MCACMANICVTFKPYKDSYIHMYMYIFTVIYTYVHISVHINIYMYIHIHICREIGPFRAGTVGRTGGLSARIFDNIPEGDHYTLYF
jgi:hypothetical protein